MPPVRSGGMHSAGFGAASRRAGRRIRNFHRVLGETSKAVSARSRAPRPPSPFKAGATCRRSRVPVWISVWKPMAANHFGLEFTALARSHRRDLERYVRSRQG